MKTFKAAFKLALQDAGFQPKKINRILTVWEKKGMFGRRDMPNAVVAAVRRTRCPWGLGGSPGHWLDQKGACDRCG